MREFTLILPYYENAGMLGEQYNHVVQLPEDVRKRLHLVICDDGSPQNPATPVVKYSNPPVMMAGGQRHVESIGAEAMEIASFQLFRVDVDVRWNWLTCRNIGALHARTEWLLLTDIDHLLPEATARRIIEGPLDPARAYRFNRVDAPDMKPTIGKHGERKPHPNTWLLTKTLFDRIGGYDERFSGFYGSDGEFRDRLKKHAGEPIILPEVMIRVPREVVPDASTTRYGRKEEQDRAGIQAARARIAKEGGRPHRLTFPYRRIV